MLKAYALMLKDGHGAINNVLGATIQDNVFKELSAAQIQNVLSQLALHVFAVVVTAGCAILLYRTALGARNSRFLKHLAISVLINVVFRLGSIVNLLLKAELSFINGNKNPVDANVSQTLTTLNSTWNGIDIIISLLSTLFLFAAWDLLRRYPNEGIGRSLYTILTTFFGTGSLLTIAISLLILAEKIQDDYWKLLDAMDVVTATIVLFLVGWQLQKTLGPNMKTKNRILRAMLLWMTTFAYFIWGIDQPAYYVLKDFPWYSILLLMSGLSATILTIILCSQALEEKPEYNTAIPPSR